MVESAEATVTIHVSAAGLLLADDFGRPDSGVVGNGWVETEAGGAEVEVEGGALFFGNTSDVVDRPMVKHSFASVQTGTVQWDFAFDWARTGNEGTYFLFMQLGDSSLMSDNDHDSGVAVNLVWTKLGGIHEQLGFRDNGAAAGIAALSGSAQISVVADLDLGTYDVKINGATVSAGLPFDSDSSIDTVRFFVDRLNENNFAGRAFDNLVIAAAG